MSSSPTSFGQPAAPAFVGGRRLLRGALLGAALLAAPGLRAQQPQQPAGGARVAAVPVIVWLTAADTGQTASVEVRNEGTAPAQLRYYLGDFEQDQNGDFTFRPFGQGEHTCGARLSSFPDGAVLGPGERQQVQLRLAAAAGVCWGMLFVETLPQGQGAVKIAQRIGIKVLNNPPGTPADGEVTTVAAQSARDTVRVHAVFQNTGRAILSVKGRIEIRSFAGTVLAHAEFGPYGSLPARARVLDVEIPAKLPPGDYLAVPIVDFGGDYLAGGQANFRVR